MDTNSAVQVAVQNEDEKDVKEIEKPFSDQVNRFYTIESFSKQLILFSKRN